MTSTLIDVSGVREHVETDLLDSALGRLIDDADAEIIRLYGAHTAAITERFTPGPSDLYVFTRRPVSSVTSVTEAYTGVMGEVETLLTTDDYAIEGDTKIRRRQGGEWSASSWAPRVTVVYTPVSDNARRTRVLIDLVRLASQHEGVDSSKLGDVQVTHGDYEADRYRILGRLDTLSSSFA